MEYAVSAAEMLQFTDSRNDDTADELWLLEHPPIYTRGTSCRTEVTHNPSGIPVVQSNRGGQLTYHGPGQLIVYLLLDIKRLGVGPRRLVETIEESLIKLLSHYGLSAGRRQGAPGVYLDDRKIAALGLRIRNGKCFHGLSLNIDMDKSPFERIDPCGIEGLEVTQLSDHGVNPTTKEAGFDLVNVLASEFEWDLLSPSYESD